MTHFSAHGKLLLTGEYLVLHGAVALALPTRLGQTLTVEPASDAHLQWVASTPNGHWFSATLNPDTLEVIDTDDTPKAQKLADILKVIKQLNPEALTPGLRFETQLEFDPSWGLGSSSTLISLLSQWAKVNPYTLLQRTIGGSGYDIACATASTPIHYQLGPEGPQVREASFNPPFADHLFFVYQGKKQHSSEEVKDFNQRWNQSDFSSELQTISQLGVALPTLTYFEDFQTLLQIHENLLAHCLDREPIQRQFPDFKGILKSLGAWGGDFLLAATDMPFEQVAEYFTNKGMKPIFKYQDLIL